MGVQFVQFILTFSLIEMNPFKQLTIFEMINITSFLPQLVCLVIFLRYFKQDDISAARRGCLPIACLVMLTLNTSLLLQIVFILLKEFHYNDNETHPLKDQQKEPIKHYGRKLEQEQYFIPESDKLFVYFTLGISILFQMYWLVAYYTFNKYV